MAISKEAKPLECRGRFRSDIIAGPSGFEPETSCFELYYLFSSKSSNWFILLSYV
jgi:hypothetical protein